jgi:hypothetical protein
MHDLSATIRRNTLLLAAVSSTLALVGGYGLETAGAGALAVGATAIVVSPVAWILWRTEAPRAAPENS